MKRGKGEQDAFNLGVSPKKDGQPAEPPANTASPANTSTPSMPDNWIEEMVGALFDPLIVFPAQGWEKDIPEKLKNELPLRRLAHLMLCSKGEASWEEATDLEALIYLYPASLMAPMSEQWTRIYLYLGTKCYGKQLPDDIKQESLSDYDMAQLRDLKRWIYKKRVQARKARARGEKAEAKTEPVKYEQMRFL